MKLVTTREAMYGHFGSPKRYQYIARLDGETIANSETSKDVAEQTAYRDLLGAWRQTTATIHAAVACDGTVCVTREYQPGQVEFTYCRNGVGGSTMLSRLEIDDHAVSVAEYHAHYVACYNAAVGPVGAGCAKSGA
jgi:hypothetical protein